MEYYDCQMSDIFDAEVRTEMDQILNSAQLSTSSAATELHFAGTVDTIDLSNCNSNSNEIAGDSTELINLSWLQNGINGSSTSLDFSQLSSAMDVHNLLVDPQTGSPVTLDFLLNQQNGVQQQQVSRPSQPPQQHQTVRSALEAQNFAQQQASQQILNSQVPYQLQQHYINSNIHVIQNGTVQNGKHTKIEPQPSDNTQEKVYPKPAYSYSCLITMALKNSKTGCLPVSEIYAFMCENFPYFKTAPDGWKNSVRHNLSLNKCFAKIEKPQSSSGSSRKGCLWALNPDKIAKMEEEVSKWTKKDPAGIRRAMACPEDLPSIENGTKGLPGASPNKPSKATSKHSSSSNTVVMSSPALTTTCAPTTTTLANDFMNTDILSLDTHLELGLQDTILDNMNYDTLSMDLPVTTPFPVSLAAAFLDTSPVKDSSHSLHSGLDSQYTFSSPSRPSVTAYM
ncbi:forkhead box protein N4-like [Anneissia japonica]|uniref:forkhead box protein N4-like n=1 Tax=Anneissia japonica TaxID=1529436 RepID=UPI0014257E18|nr:forkhead box protein N4-like [Anneissia japonica]